MCDIPKSTDSNINNTLPCIIPLSKNIIVGIIASNIAFLIDSILKYKNHTKQYTIDSIEVKNIYKSLPLVNL